MAIEFECPACSAVLHVSDDYVGRTIRCGGCLAALVVPDGPPAPTRRPPRTDAPADPRPGAEEPPPPRRRKTRPELLDEPEEKPGRGPFFWLVVVGAIILLFGVSCCGGLWAVLPQADWHKHESANGRFRAEFPAPVQPRVAAALKIDLDGETRDEGTVLVRNLKVFEVIYRDVPEKDRLAAPAQLDKLVAQTKEWLEAKAIGGVTETQVNGFPARDFEVRSDTKGYYLVRVVVAGERVYVAFAGGALARPRDKDANRFRNSFEILPKGKDE